METIMLLIMLVPTDQYYHTGGTFETGAECVEAGIAYEEMVREDYRNVWWGCVKLSAAPLTSPRPKPRGNRE